MDPPTTTLSYGVPQEAVRGLDARIERAFGISLEARESLFKGGWYSLGQLPSGEALRVYANYNEFERTWREPRRRQFPAVFYISGVSAERCDELRAVVRERLPELVEFVQEPTRTLVNVVAVECTSWEGAPPPSMAAEIIEVGVTVLDLRTVELGPTRSILVRPARSVISSHCERLTGLTQDRLVADGVEFREVVGELRSGYFAKERPWVTWDDDVRRRFDDGCRMHAVPSPFGRRHLDVKSLFVMAFGLESTVAVSFALTMLELPPGGARHRAGDRSRDIASILRQLVARMRGG
jgi:inhibitor of KinA sporulation pathway (predicted exonuclease)